VDQTPRDDAEKPGVGRADMLLQAAFFIGVIVLALVAGSILTAANVPPGPQIADAYKGGLALYQQATVYEDVFRSDLWPPSAGPSAASQCTTPRPRRKD